MFHLRKSLIFIFIFILNFVFSLTSAINSEILYKAKGDDVVLNPHSEAPVITSTVWYHKGNMAVDWDGADPEYYHPFKGRCTLDQTTGALTIRGLNGSENGVFSVAINYKQLDMKIHLFVISKVPKPTISLVCDTDSTSCTLTCDGNTTGAGPVTYKWFTDGSELGSDKELKITTETKEETFFCMLLNPVSNMSSDSFSNRIKEGERNRLIVVSVTVLAVLSALIIGLVLFFIRRRNGGSFNPNGTRKGAEPGTAEGRSFKLNGTRKEAEKGTPEEKVEMLPNGEVNHVSEVQQEPNHNGSGPAVIHNGVGGSAVSETHRVQIERPEPPEPQNDGNSSEEAQVEAGTSVQDPERAESPGTSEETGEGGNTSGTAERPNQDLTGPESVNTSEETKNSAVTSDNHEPTNQQPDEGGKGGGEEDGGGEGGEDGD